jgi:hypothetical protein
MNAAKAIEAVKSRLKETYALVKAHKVPSAILVTAGLLLGLSF